MENLNTMITDMLGPFGPLMLVGMLGVFLILLTLPILLKKQADPLDRLKSSSRKEGKKGEQLRGAQSNDKLETYANFLEPQNREEYSAIKLKLVQAGYHSKNAVRMYYFGQFSLGILGLVLGGIYALLQLQQGVVETTDLLMMVGIPAGAGYMGPKYWVTRRQAGRQEAITNGFPDSLDMMLVCVEAGQSLDQSILRVSAELK